MDILKNVNGLSIKQITEMWEVFLPLETRNKYEVYDLDGKKILFAYEIQGNLWYSWFMRSLLVAMRPFSICVMNEEGKQLLKLTKSFKFYFHRVSIYDENNNYIGKVVRKFSLIHKYFHVYDNSENLICELKGPIWKPWTFEVIQNGAVYGQICKKWSGALKEFFVDADYFGVTFPDTAKPTSKALLLSAVFLIDFVYFEGNPGMNWIPIGYGD